MISKTESPPVRRAFCLYLVMRISILCFYLFCGFAADAQNIRFYNWMGIPCPDSMARYVSVIKKTDSGWLRNDIFLATKKSRLEGLYEDSVCEIPNGWIKQFYSNGSLLSVGRFVHGAPEGTFISYHYNGAIRDSIFYVSGVISGLSKRWHRNGYISDSVVHNMDGSATAMYWFNNGIPSAAGKIKRFVQDGRWRYFHRNGNLAAIEEYQEGKLQSRIYFDEDGKQIMDTANRDRPAMFRGSNNRSGKWRKYVENSLIWPRGVKLVNTDTVTILVIATINEKGNITDAYVDVPFNPVFDEIVLRAIKKSPRWSPAISHNRYVEDYLFEPVDFIDRRKKD